MSRVRDERIKLFAGYLNTMAAGTFIAGFLAPTIGIAVGDHPRLFPIVYFALISIVLSVLLHLMAQAILGRLDG